MSANNFSSKAFEGNLREIELAGTQETVLAATDTPPLDEMAGAFESAGVDQIAVIGWSSQGPAQAQNLRDSLKVAGSSTKVVVGLREGSPSREAAEAAGFDLESDTLMTVSDALSSSAMSLMLIADAAMAKDGHELVDMMPEGSTLGLSHGFWLGHLEAQDETPRPGVNIVGVCPKGMGPSVRRLYEMGSGINSSFAYTQGDPASQELALAWSIGIGAPYTFKTTLENEWRSDIFGERAILLGGVQGIVEAVYAWKRENGAGAEEAYLETVESLVGPLSKTISHKGLEGVFESLDDTDKQVFGDAYQASYPVLRDLINKIYTDVSSGREIGEVVADNENSVPMTKVDGTNMWRAGERVRAARGEGREDTLEIDPVVAGIYVAGMMAQVDVLRANGHYWSEVVNESIIEAVDSLNPFMQAKGVAFMVDNCSVTARRGGRKWAPLFQAWISQGILPYIDSPNYSHDHVADFLNHDVHGVLRTLATMRPDVDISVS